MSFTATTGTNKTAVASASGTTLGMLLTGTVPVGTLIWGVWSINNATPTPSVADNSAQAGAANVYTVVTRTGATWGWGVFYCVLTRSLVLNDTITLTTASSSRRAVAIQGFTPSNANPVLDTTAAVLNNDSTSPIGPTASSGTLGAADALLVAGTGIKDDGSGSTGWSHTSPGGWTNGAQADSGGTVTATHARISYLLSSGNTSAFTVTDAYAGPGVLALAGIEAYSWTDLSGPPPSDSPARMRRS